MFVVAWINTTTKASIGINPQMFAFEVLPSLRACRTTGVHGAVSHALYFFQASNGETHILFKYPILSHLTSKPTISDHFRPFPTISEPVLGGVADCGLRIAELNPQMTSEGTAASISYSSVISETINEDPEPEHG
jgi:hypothetical protein